MPLSLKKIINFIDYAPRRIYNSAVYALNKKDIDTLHRTVEAIDINSSEYCAAMAEFADVFLKRKDVLCNFESPILTKLAESDMPVIYVMNHNTQGKDPSMMLLFNALLNVKYLELGKSAISPRPRILINQNIIKSQSAPMRDIYKKCGAVGLDIISDKANNTGSLLNVIKGYLSGKSNIFIFPEGRNGIRRDLPFEERFQDGISSIIERITSTGRTAKVVPLGFDYNKDSQILGSIYIGEPIYFKKSGNRMLTNSANSTSEFTPAKFKDTFNGRFIKEIKGIKEISNHIIENMKICMAEAHKRLLAPDNIEF